jgi:predicted O-methyltransferase YrrM
MHIALSKSLVSNVDLTHLAHFLQWNPVYQKYFLEEPGKEPFKLIAYLSKHIGGNAIDMGTLYGSSALALSYNEDTQVLTLDVKKHIPETQDIVTPLNRTNIRMIVASCQSILPHAAKADLILLDIDINLTTEIKKIVHDLIYYKYKGVLVLDNIHVNQDMKQVWNEIPTQIKKIDATSIGHHTGTGILIFNPSNIDITLC